VALTRDLSNPLAYDEGAVRDPLVRDLARRIELEPDEAGGHAAPYVWPADVIIECGELAHTLRTRPPKGAPSNPFTWPEICEKFRRYTCSVLDDTRVAAIIGIVGRLEQLTDMTELGGLVARS
jgi:2-methylcitrate dehydratase PrpD